MNLIRSIYQNWNVAALFLYGLLSVILFRGYNVNDDLLFGHGPDPFTFTWYLAWWPWAISRGLNPLVTELAFIPGGYNLAWGTSVPTAALLGLPLTLLTSPATSFNTLMLLAPVLSAWCAFLLTRYITKDVRSALFGGLLFGFSSYELGHLLGHLNLVLTFPIPLVVLLLVARVRGDIKRVKFIGFLTLSLLTLFGCSSEMFASLCTLGAGVWLVFFLCQDYTGRRQLFTVACEIAVASVLLTILLLPFLITMLVGASEIARFVNSPTLYSTDLLNFIVPTSVTRLGRTLFQDIAGRFTANAAEQGAYLGVPLLVILVMFARQIGDNRYLRALLLTIIMLVVLTLGPVFQIAGVNTGIPLPWSVTAYLPLLEGALPARFTLYISLATSIAASFWLSRSRFRSNAVACYCLAVTACLFILPNSKLFVWRASPALDFFAPTNLEQALGQHAKVVILPFEANGAGMYWQMQSGFRFSQAGGYFSFLPKSYQTLLVLQLQKGMPEVGFEADFSSFCLTKNLDAVVIGPGTPPPLRDAILRIGWQTEVIGGVQLVRVPKPQP